MNEPRVITADDQGVRILTMSHPPSLNGLGPVMRAQLMSEFAIGEADPDVHAIIIAGDDGNFSAGSDIGAILGQPPQARVDRLEEFQQFLTRWHQLDKPVLVAVEGAAAGGGVSMILAADWAVGATDSRYVGGWISLGLAPDAGALWWLVRVLGRKQTFEWLHSRAAMTAADAQASGILTATCPPGETLERAVERARHLISLPPVARGETKKLIAAAMKSSSIEAFLPIETASLGSLFASDEHKDAVQAFLDRRSR